MESKNLLTLAITLTLGIILAGSVLMPVITDAQTNMGNPVVYTNVGQTGGDLYVSDNILGSHSVILDASTNTVTYDGEAISDPVRGYLVVSDAITVMFTGAYFTICYGDDYYQYNASWGTSYEMTFEDGTATMVRTTSNGTTTSFTEQYTWIGYRVTEGGNYVTKLSDAVAYYTDLSQILAMGDYYTGDNDTFYLLYKGEFSITADYEASVTLEDDIYAGTTDIKQGGLAINVGDETFTPYVWAVAKEIHGHATAGAAYSLLGALPIIVIIGLVLAATAAIMVKRDD